MSTIRREYQWKKFGLKHEYPDRFLWCQWQLQTRTSTCYLIYRLLFACLFLGTTAYVLSIEPYDSQISDGNKYFQGSEYLARWPAYLTNWGYMLIDVVALLAAVLVSCRCIKECLKKEESEQKPCKMCGILKLYWALHTTAMVTSIGITITYWITIYHPSVPITAHNVLKHITNSIFMVIDFFVVSFPYRILHFYLPVLFVTIYLAFSGVYYAAGGLSVSRDVYLYPILDWRSPERAVVNCFFGLIFVAFLHHVVYVLYLLRRWVHSKLIVPKNVDPVLYCNSVTAVNTA